MTTILLAGGGTGGHLMPLLAIGDRIRQRHPDWRVVLAGSRHGIEATLLPTRDYPYHLLSTEPFYRRAWWRNVKWPVLAIRVLREVNRLLDAEAPDVVLGTGGYASGPVLWGAARRSIPTIVFDGDAVPGIASRWASRKARQVYLAFPEARRHLPETFPGEVFITGAPIIPPDTSVAPGARQRFGLAPDRPVVLITGGSQGSRAINLAVADWVSSGAAKECQVLWATGRGTHGDFAHLHDPPSVQVFSFLDPIREAYAVADLAVARGGTMSLTELGAWGIPTIVIPLPSAAADHQTSNARALEQAGAARVLLQSDLTGERLGRVVGDLLGDPLAVEGMRRAALVRSRPGATDDIAARVAGLIGAP
jgi:UDP-N-acetylglucosamine--N-acetylmuramyl-(pentapeptide) pyrophosphoryl-undecaprenol N-acetylglucosamine transferase